MLHILFLILKIIGMILLVILGILIVLVFSVFFMPANYLIQAKTEDGIKGLAFEAKAHWFLHLLTVYYIYRDKQSDWQVRIGWKTFNHKDHESSLRTAKKDESKKIKCTNLKICDKIKSFWKTKEKVTSFLTDDVHVEAFKIVKREIGILARHLRPRRIRGIVRFGFEDPYRTGQVLAGLSILYPFYGEHVEIYPDFEQKILVGDLYIKGHIRMVHLATLLWRLFFNRYIRKTYTDYKKVKIKIKE